MLRDVFQISGWNLQISSIPTDEMNPTAICQQPSGLSQRKQRRADSAQHFSDFDPVLQLIHTQSRHIGLGLELLCSYEYAPPEIP